MGEGREERMKGERRRSHGRGEREVGGKAKPPPLGGAPRRGRIAPLSHLNPSHHHHSPFPSQGRKCAPLVLDLGNNSISEEGATSIAALLTARPTLTDLTLYMNDIGDRGVAKV